MGTPWAADEHMHPGCHETVDSECVEMDVLFKMGHCAGVCTGGEDKRTCGPVHSSCSRRRNQERVTAPLWQTLHVDVLHWEVGGQYGQWLPP